MTGKNHGSERSKGKRAGNSVQGSKPGDMSASSGRGQLDTDGRKKPAKRSRQSRGSDSEAGTNPVDPKSGEGYMNSNDADYGRESYGGGTRRINNDDENGTT